MADSKVLSEEIDQLLEQYLHLLDQYTTLRTQLSTAQASIQHNIARANFTADRGIRYGRDCYDERMQATRGCQVDETHISIHQIEQETSSEEKTKKKDPLRMFGILTPQALRAAQREAVQMVEEFIPKLATVNADMERMEIEIRRKKKFRAKAEAKGLAEERGSVVECAS